MAFACSAALRFSVLRWDQCRDYAALLFPYHRRQMLTGPLPDTEAVAVACDGRPAGLGLLELPPDVPGLARVRSVAVFPEYRNRGIGAALLMELERAARAHGRHTIQLRYADTSASRFALERVLAKNGWAGAELNMMACRTDYETFGRAPWLKLDRLPPEFETVLWNSLDPEDWRCLARDARTPSWYPEALTPLVPADQVEVRASLFLRYRGQIAGWCVVGIVDDATLRAARLYIREDLDGHARAIALLGRAFRYAAQYERKQYVFDVAADRPGMLRFVERRMRPYLTSVRCFLQSAKFLR